MLQSEPNSKGKPAAWMIRPKYAGCLTILYNPVSQTVCPLSAWILTVLEKNLFCFCEIRNRSCPKAVRMHPNKYRLR